MGAKLEYTIVDAPTTNELIEQVESMISVGFEPIGGVSIDRCSWENERKGYEETSVAFFQAMIKR